MSLLTAGIVTVCVSAQQPKIVVGIIVDGLRQEYIDLLRNEFGKDGFNRLLNQGLVFENVDYGPGLDATAAAAVVMTGASPSVNGIPGSLIFDEAARRNMPVFDDGKTLGNFTNETYSPAALRTTTVTDEARIAGAGVTYAHAIATDPQMAMVLGGHSANSAVWINDKTGNWAGSTAYKEFPLPAANTNRLSALTVRLDTMQWAPAKPAAAQALLPDHLSRYPFRHTFGRGNAQRLAAFKNSPLANREVTRLATEYVKSLQLGQHPGGADVINVAYTLQPYEFTKTAENRYELIDSYIRLDSDIANLISAAEAQAGRGNALVYLAATPPTNVRRRDDEKWNVPSGEFSTRKAISLLNLYLIALHGNGEWVNAYANNTFYLNSELAKQQNVPMGQLSEEVADFLKRMSGVERAYTIDAILDGRAPVEDPQALRRNTVVAHSGDVRIDIVPGWELLDDFNYPGQHNGKVASNALSTAPAYLLIPGAEPKTVATPVDARILAPTVARQLRIRSPNGSTVAPASVSMVRP